MAATTYGSISPRTAAWAVMPFLKRVQTAELVTKMGMQTTQPKNGLDTGKFRRPNPLPLLVTPAVEGVTPASQAISFTDVTYQLDQWVSVTETTDKVIDLHEDPVLQTHMELIADQFVDTKETLALNVLRAGTNVIYANGAARNAVNTALTLNKIRASIRFLKGQRAKMITKTLDASTNIGTRPVEPAFVCVIHTDLENDVRNLANFLPVAAYGTRKIIADCEIGSVENTRFCTTPLLSPLLSAGGSVAVANTFLVNGGNGTGNADVYPVLIFGEDAFGHVATRGGGAVVPMVVNPTPSAADPAAQRGYVSGKTYYKCVRLNEAWMVRIEVAATAL